MVSPLSIFAGPSPLPPQTSTVTGTYAPTQFQQGQADIATGAGLTQQGQALGAGAQSLMAGGQSALAMAEAGQLTPEQQASLNLYTQGLQNTALTTYGNLGINPSESTSFISTEANIAQQSIAMGQSFIQSTIALAGTEFQAAGTEFSAAGSFLSAGQGFTSVGQQSEQAGTQDLLATAQMQVAQDTAYSNLIGSTLGSIAKIFSGGAIGAGLTSALGGGSASQLAAADQSQDVLQDIQEG